MFRYIKIDLFSGALFLIIASPNHHSAQNHERQQVVAYDTIQPKPGNQHYMHPSLQTSKVTGVDLREDETGLQPGRAPARHSQY